MTQQRETWEYAVFTAVENAKQSNYIIAYANNRVEKPRGNSRVTIMAELGRDGWELTAVNQLAQGINEFYFKRPIR